MLVIYFQVKAAVCQGMCQRLITAFFFHTYIDTFTPVL